MAWYSSLGLRLRALCRRARLRRILSSFVSFVGIEDAEQIGGMAAHLVQVSDTARKRNDQLDERTSSDGLYLCPHHSNSE